MNAKEHLNFSLYSIGLVGTGYAVKQLINIDILEDKEVLLQIATGVLAGSLLPDIDHRNGMLSKVIPLYLIHDLLKRVNIHLFRHGGITHTILVNMAIVWAGIYFKNMLVVSIGFGYFTHLYIDHITGNQLPILCFPIKIKRRK